MERIVIALGGNAIISAGEKGTTKEQFDNVGRTTKHIADLIKAGHQVVITHGNGPQVGNLLIQHDAAKDQVPPLTMDVCGAQSQGQIGYMIAQTLRNHLAALGIVKAVGTIVTQTQVDAADPAFQKPSKPVGPFYKTDDLLKSQGFAYIEDAGRGYRRVVPSPKPSHIVEIDIVNTLLEKDAVVIASGGGGVPVLKEKHGYKGVEAVIDKDLAGELLAEEVKANRLIILTDVEKVAVNYKKPDQKDLSALTLSQAKEYAAAGHFAAGSMGPKVEAAINFVERTGGIALITSPYKIMEALEGKTGTIISK